LAIDPVPCLKSVVKEQIKGSCQFANSVEFLFEDVHPISKTFHDLNGVFLRLPDAVIQYLAQFFLPCCSLNDTLPSPSPEFISFWPVHFCLSTPVIDCWIVGGHDEGMSSVRP